MNPSSLSFGGTFDYSKSPDLSSLFSPEQFKYEPSFEGSFSVAGKPEQKQGFDWKTLLVGLGQASPAIERAILRLRGFPESSIGYSPRSPRMAGSELAAFLQSQASQGSDSLAKTLEAAAGGMLGDLSDFTPSKSLSVL